MANYIKLCIAYTTYRNHTSSQPQFKTSVPQGVILSPKLINIYTADIPAPKARVQVYTQVDSHLHTQARVQQKIHTTIPSYSLCMDKTKYSHTKSRQNNLHYVHSRPCRIYEQSLSIYYQFIVRFPIGLDLMCLYTKIDNNCMEQSGHQNKQHGTTGGNAPQSSGPYLKPKTHIQHTHSHHLSASTHATTIDKITHSNRMGKQKETFVATYNAVMSPALENASCILEKHYKLQIMQNAALRLRTTT